MIMYKEENGITTKIELEEIGWSCLDASKIYKAKITDFSIAEGIISTYTRVVNADGSDYKPKYYRTYWHEIKSIN